MIKMLLKNNSRSWSNLKSDFTEEGNVEKLPKRSEYQNLSESSRDIVGIGSFFQWWIFMASNAHLRSLLWPAAPTVCKGLGGALGQASETHTGLELFGLLLLSRTLSSSLWFCAFVLFYDSDDEGDAAKEDVELVSKQLKTGLVLKNWSVLSD